MNIEEILGYSAAVIVCFIFHDVTHKDVFGIRNWVQNLFKKKPDPTKCNCEYPIIQDSIILRNYCGECGRKLK